VPPIKFRIKNGKQTPTGRKILHRVRWYLLTQWQNGRMNDDDRNIIQLAIRDVDVCLSRLHKNWRGRF
jgi:hypothetical protein